MTTQTTTVPRGTTPAAPVTTEPRPGTPGSASMAAQPPTLRSLRRLLPWVRPALPALIASALMAALASVAGLVFPLVIQWIVDGPVRARSMSGLWGPAALLLALGIVESALFYVRRLMVARSITSVEASMRAALYAHLQRLPVSFHDRWPAGQLLSRAGSDLSTIRRFLGFSVVFLVVNLVTTLTGLVLLLRLSFRLGLIVAALAIPLVLLCFLFESRYRVLARRSQDQVGDLATTVEESVLGIRILKAFGRSSYLGARFRAQAAELRGTEVGKARIVSWLWASVISLPEIALGTTLALGIRQVADGQLSAGTLIAFFGIAMGLRWPIDSIGWLLAQINETASATTRYFEVMDVQPGIVTPPDPVPAPSGVGELRMDRVRFRFPDAPATAPDLLRGLDLRLRPGESLALVGATGSGKTTLTSLVNRLYDVTGGSITLDGVDVRDLSLEQLRSRVAVAFEEPILFSASVRDNVVMSRAGIDDAAVRAALAVAQADFVSGLPDGLDTIIGEQGLSLSGGQRQRLALARAVAGRPAVLVLDDPLSALDIHTEALVEQALRAVLGSSAALVVAHRLSTVLLADRVALLADGVITAVGTHAELMAGVPAYAELLR